MDILADCLSITLPLSCGNSYTGHIDILQRYLHHGRITASSCPNNVYNKTRSSRLLPIHFGCPTSTVSDTVGLPVVITFVIRDWLAITLEFDKRVWIYILVTFRYRGWTLIPYEVASMTEKFGDHIIHPYLPLVSLWSVCPTP